MKKYITLIAVLLVSTITLAQTTINASDILNDIKAGKDVVYNNVTIKGDLDFTFMDEALPKLPERKKWWNNGGSNIVDKAITGKISFTNCTFKDNVLAYIPHEKSGYTFTANFEDAVIFTNCTFEEKAMFKYSTFERNSDFSGSKFLGDSTFKYAKFERDIAFENTKFDEPATFKYTKFDNFVSFKNSVFRETATFKYTKFNDGVSFNNVNFKEDLNLKYANVRGDFDITGMEVAYEIDSKYTKINGKSFNKHLLNNRN